MDWPDVCTLSFSKVPVNVAPRCQGRWNKGTTSKAKGVIMARQVYTDWRKEAVPPEVEELRGYLNQLPLPWREKMHPRKQ